MECVSPRVTLCVFLSFLFLCLVICDAAFWSAKEKKREENGFNCADDNCRTIAVGSNLVLVAVYQSIKKSNNHCNEML